VIFLPNISNAMVNPPELRKLAELDVDFNRFRRPDGLNAGRECG